MCVCRNLVIHEVREVKKTKTHLRFPKPESFGAGEEWCTVSRCGVAWRRNLGVGGQSFPPGSHEDLASIARLTNEEQTQIDDHEAKQQ